MTEPIKFSSREIDMSEISLKVEYDFIFLPVVVFQLFIVPSFDAVNTSFVINLVDFITL